MTAGFFCIAVLISSKAQAHAFLDHARPAVGSTVTAPKQIQIWFTEQIDPTGTSIKVIDLNGRQIDRQDSRADQRQSNLESVTVPYLSPGTYQVIWKALCMGGHTTGGSFKFTVTK
jgi:methionine-rich copper-binding protein CopC